MNSWQRVSCREGSGVEGGWGFLVVIGGFLLGYLIGTAGQAALGRRK